VRISLSRSSPTSLANRLLSSLAPDTEKIYPFPGTTKNFTMKFSIITTSMLLIGAAVATPIANPGPATTAVADLETRQDLGQACAAAYAAVRYWYEAWEAATTTDAINVRSRPIRDCL
jgi:hypothetical protein